MIAKPAVILLPADFEAARMLLADSLTIADMEDGAFWCRVEIVVSSFGAAAPADIPRRQDELPKLLRWAMKHFRTAAQEASKKEALTAETALGSVLVPLTDGASKVSGLQIAALIVVQRGARLSWATFGRVADRVALVWDRNADPVHEVPLAGTVEIPDHEDLAAVTAFELRDDAAPAARPRITALNALIQSVWSLQIPPHSLGAIRIPLIAISRGLPLLDQRLSETNTQVNAVLRATQRALREFQNTIPAAAGAVKDASNRITDVVGTLTGGRDEVAGAWSRLYAEASGALQHLSEVQQSWIETGQKLDHGVVHTAGAFDAELRRARDLFGNLGRAHDDLRHLNERLEGTTGMIHQAFVARDAELIAAVHAVTTLNQEFGLLRQSAASTVEELAKDRQALGTSYLALEGAREDVESARGRLREVLESLERDAESGRQTAGRLQQQITGAYAEQAEKAAAIMEAFRADLSRARELVGRAGEVLDIAAKAQESFTRTAQSLDEATMPQLGALSETVQKLRQAGGAVSGLLDSAMEEASRLKMQQEVAGANVRALADATREVDATRGRLTSAVANLEQYTGEWQGVAGRLQSRIQGSLDKHTELGDSLLDLRDNVVSTVQILKDARLAAASIHGQLTNDGKEFEVAVREATEARHSLRRITQVAEKINEAFTGGMDAVEAFKQMLPRFTATAELLGAMNQGLRQQTDAVSLSLEDCAKASQQFTADVTSQRARLAAPFQTVDQFATAFQKEAESAAEKLRQLTSTIALLGRETEAKTAEITASAGAFPAYPEAESDRLGNLARQIDGLLTRLRDMEGDVPRRMAASATRLDTIVGDVETIRPRLDKVLASLEDVDRNQRGRDARLAQPQPAAAADEIAHAQEVLDSINQRLDGLARRQINLNLPTEIQSFPERVDRLRQELVSAQDLLRQKLEILEGGISEFRIDSNQKIANLDRRLDQIGLPATENVQGRHVTDLGAPLEEIRTELYALREQLNDFRRTDAALDEKVQQLTDSISGLRAAAEKAWLEPAPRPALPEMGTLINPPSRPPDTEKTVQVRLSGQDGRASRSLPSPVERAGLWSRRPMTWIPWILVLVLSAYLLITRFVSPAAPHPSRGAAPTEPSSKVEQRPPLPDSSVDPVAPDSGTALNARQVDASTSPPARERRPEKVRRRPRKDEPGKDATTPDDSLKNPTPAAESANQSRATGVGGAEDGPRCLERDPAGRYSSRQAKRAWI